MAGARGAGAVTAGRRTDPDRDHRAHRVRQVAGRPLAGGARGAGSWTRTGSHARSTAPGTPVHAAILRRFGAAVTAPDGTLDRAALGRVVFADPAALRDLEALVHPAVRPRILEAIDGGRGCWRQAVVIEAIKLVEGGLAGLCDEVWLVACDPAVQRERLLARGTPAPDADQRIAAQAGLVGAAPAVGDPRAGHVRRGGGDAAGRGRGLRGGAGRRRLSGSRCRPERAEPRPSHESRSRRRNRPQRARPTPSDANAGRRPRADPAAAIGHSTRPASGPFVAEDLRPVASAGHTGCRRHGAGPTVPRSGRTIGHGRPMGREAAAGATAGCDLLPRLGPGRWAASQPPRPEREPAANRTRVSGAVVSRRPPGRAGPTGRLGGAPGQRRAAESGRGHAPRAAGVRPRRRPARRDREVSRPAMPKGRPTPRLPARVAA